MELDVVAKVAGREAGLREVALIGIEAEHPGRTATFHLDRIEAAVAANIEHGLAGEVVGKRGREPTPLQPWIIAEKVIGRSPDPAEVDVVEPGPEGVGLPA
ncbi:hypothetical protein OFEAOIEE_LOCUS4221 [Methylorubrum extorquens]